MSFAAADPDQESDQRQSRPQVAFDGPSMRVAGQRHWLILVVDRTCEQRKSKFIAEERTDCGEASSQRQESFGAGVLALSGQLPPVSRRGEFGKMQAWQAAKRG